MRGCSSRAIVVAHLSEWIQMNILTEWFKHFINSINPTLESTDFDGHFNYIYNIDPIDPVRQNKYISKSFIRKFESLIKRYKSSYTRIILTKTDFHKAESRKIPKISLL